MEQSNISVEEYTQISIMDQLRSFFDVKWNQTVNKIKEEGKKSLKLRTQQRVNELREKSNQTRITDDEAEEWAAELDKQCVDKMSEEYNRWHDLDDNLSTLQLLRGLHNIQENGGNSADEKRFCDTVTDHFGHKRFEFNDETVAEEEKRLFGCQFPHQCGHRGRLCENGCPNQQN